MSPQAVTSRIKRSKSTDSHSKPRGGSRRDFATFYLWSTCSPHQPARWRTRCPSQQPPLSFRHTHPQQEAMQVLRVSPLLKDAVQGLDVPGATSGVPPGDKAFGRRKVELCWRAAPPRACRQGPPPNSDPLTPPAGAAHISALRPTRDPISSSPPPRDPGYDSRSPNKETKAWRTQETPLRDKKGRRLTPVTHAL